MNDEDEGSRVNRWRRDTVLKKLKPSAACEEKAVLYQVAEISIEVSMLAS